VNGSIHRESLSWAGPVPRVLQLCQHQGPGTPSGRSPGSSKRVLGAWGFDSRDESIADPGEQSCCRPFVETPFLPDPVVCPACAELQRRKCNILPHNTIPKCVDVGDLDKKSA
jgi:hypothetical protein